MRTSSILAPAISRISPTARRCPPAAIGAALNIAAASSGKNIAVLMPYNDRLEKAVIPSQKQIVDAIRALVRRDDKKA